MYLLLFLLFCSKLSAGVLEENSLKLIKNEDILEEWKVRESEIDPFSRQYKQGEHSSIDWDIGHNKLLSFTHWKSQRALKDKDPYWKLKLNDAKYQERVGNVIVCKNDCYIYRGLNVIKARYNSRLLEGDEFVTGDKSEAWVVLADGSLIRLVQNSSVSISEVNIGKNNQAIYARLNRGFLYWDYWRKGTFESLDMAETSGYLYPLKILKSNREFWARKEYQQMTQDQFVTYATQSNKGYRSQYEKLNNLLLEKAVKRRSQHFLILPNVTLNVQFGDIAAFYEVNGRGYFKISSNREGFSPKEKLEATGNFQIRGYKEINQIPVRADQWISISNDGRKYTNFDDGEKNFKQVLSSQLRIPTIYLAREYYLRRHYQFNFEDLSSADEFAISYGYRLWNKKELDQRAAYLTKINRRVETTNLSSLNKLYKDKILGEFDQGKYKYILTDYVKYLKKLNSKERVILPELNRSEYYVWVLKNAKE